MYYNSNFEDIFVEEIIKSLIDSRYVDCDVDDEKEQIIFSKKDETYQEKLEIDVKTPKTLIDEASSNLDNAEETQEIRNKNSEQEDDENSKERDKSDDDKASQSMIMEKLILMMTQIKPIMTEKIILMIRNLQLNNHLKSRKRKSCLQNRIKKAKLANRKIKRKRFQKDQIVKGKEIKQSKKKKEKKDKKESEKEVEDKTKNEKEVEDKTKNEKEVEDKTKNEKEVDDTKYFLLAHLYHNAEQEYHKFMFPNVNLPKKCVKKLLCDRSLLPEKEDYINANIVSMQQVDQHIKIDFDNEENKLVLTVLDKDESKFPIFSKSLLFKKLLHQEDEKENDKEVESTLIDCLNNNKILYAFVRDRITTFNSIAFPIQYELRKTLFLSVDPDLRLIMKIPDQSSNRTSLLITTDDAENDDYRIVKEDDGIYLIFNPMLMEVKNSILFKTKVDPKFLFEEKEVEDKAKNEKEVEEKSQSDNKFHSWRNKKYINVDSIVVYWEFNKSEINFLNMSRIPKIEVSTKTDLKRFHPYSIRCKSFRNEDQDSVQEIYIITTAATQEQNSEDKKYKVILH